MVYKYTEARAMPACRSGQRTAPFNFLRLFLPPYGNAWQAAPRDWVAVVQLRRAKSQSCRDRPRTHAPGQTTPPGIHSCNIWLPSLSAAAMVVNGLDLLRHIGEHVSMPHACAGDGSVAQTAQDGSPPPLDEGEKTPTRHNLQAQAP